MTYFFANWKAYLHADEAVQLAQQIAPLKYDTERTNVAVFPPMITVSEIVYELNGSSTSVGTQCIDTVPMGAYTGATSAQLAQSAGCKYALIGHSERRHVFSESDEDINKKMAACLETGIIPVLCVGETLTDRQAGAREAVLIRQLDTAFEHVNISQAEQCIIAYEPVWAISQGGLGESCSPLEVEEVHTWIKEKVIQLTGYAFPILYGGSVNSENVLSYLSLAHVDGVLVGSASTNIDSFKAILDACAQ